MTSMRKLMDAVASQGIIDPAAKTFHVPRLTEKEKAQRVRLAERELRMAKSILIERRDEAAVAEDRVTAEEDYLVAKNDYSRAKKKHKRAKNTEVLTDKDKEEAKESLEFVQRMNGYSRSAKSPLKYTARAVVAERMAATQGPVRLPKKMELTLADLVEKWSLEEDDASDDPDDAGSDSDEVDEDDDTSGEDTEGDNHDQDDEGEEEE